MNIRYGVGLLLVMQSALYAAQPVQSAEDVYALFSQSPEEIQQNGEACLARLQQGIAILVAVPDDQRTFDNTVRVYDALVEDFLCCYGPLEALSFLSPDDAVRSAASVMIQRLGHYKATELDASAEVFHALDVYAASRPQLSKKQQYLLDRVRRESSRREANLDNAMAAKEVRKEIERLEREFDENINGNASYIELSRAELIGVPDATVQGFELVGDEVYRVQCNHPNYRAVMKQCAVAETRKKMYKAFGSCAYPKNKIVLEALLKQRHKLAMLLGFPSYAHLDIKGEMAKTPERVHEFIMQLLGLAQRKAQQEAALWSATLPPSVALAPDNTIPACDLLFLQEQYKERTLHIDSTVISQYFPLEHTIQKIFSLYEQSFGLHFMSAALPGKHFWADDVNTMYMMCQKDTGVTLGYLILDLFPRHNKYAHEAAAAPVIPALKRAGSCAVCIMIANFPRPVLGRPTLLTFDNTVTFFHELGHALHAILGRTEFAYFSGLQVKNDFVEMPSQMLEGWLEDPAVLAQISCHYEKGTPLPTEIIQKLNTLKCYDSGDYMCRQLYYSLLALALHDASETKDVDEIAQRTHRLTRSHITWDPDDHGWASLIQLTVYPSKYYVYPWALVYARDLLSKFKEKGLLDSEVGRRYVRTILSRGGSKDPHALIEKFLGRPTSPAAYLADFGFDVLRQIHIPSFLGAVGSAAAAESFLKS